MISSLQGTVLNLSSTHCDVEVNNIGYEVFITADHAKSLVLGEEAFFYTSLIVREDSMTLFGFSNAEAKEIFEVLISVSGVGPRSALAVLNVLSPVEIITAVVDEEDAVFKKVSGIGPKTAKLIVVQLSGKLNLTTQPSGTKQGASDVTQQVVTALVGLGWNVKTAQNAVAEVSPEHADAASLLRATLSILSTGAK